MRYAGNQGNNAEAGSSCHVADSQPYFSKSSSLGGWNIPDATRTQSGPGFVTAGRCGNNEERWWLTRSVARPALSLL